MLAGKTVLIGVTGGVAAHYIPELIGQLRWRHMANVQVIMTPAAARFMPPLTLQVASGNPVYADLWQATERTPLIHIQLASLAHGLADDLVSLTVLATHAPVLLAPAMHQEMWSKVVVQDNVVRLQGLGYHFVGPERGPSTSGQIAEGRMASIGAIIAKLIEVGGAGSEA